MERSDILDAMGKLKLFGMKAAYDEVLTTAVKRQHEPQRVVGDLLTAEISEKQARSIKYQLTIARMPLAKEIDEFDFADTPINETLARDLVGGDFLQHQRNVVLIGGTGTGKTHLAVAVARPGRSPGPRGSRRLAYRGMDRSGAHRLACRPRRAEPARGYGRTLLRGRYPQSRVRTRLTAHLR